MPIAKRFVPFLVLGIYNTPKPQVWPLALVFAEQSVIMPSNVQVKWSEINHNMKFEHSRELFSPRSRLSGIIIISNPCDSSLT